MATQEQNLIAVFQSIGLDIKTIFTNQGNLSSLTTTQKSNLVGALNELKASISLAGAQIDDATASSSTTYSSVKINSAINTAIAEVVDGAPTAFDTLKEIADYISDDQAALQIITTALANRVKFNEPQSLTPEQQIQACENIGIGDPTADFKDEYEAARDA